MASNLLHCSICPKQPSFSDTSHLLTHVSSKGHLSHLHKLQVRSHKEIAAGHQLSIYEQWFQQHDLGRLLSERMLQKEAKQVTKRNRLLSTRKAIKKEDFVQDASNKLNSITCSKNTSCYQLPVDPGLDGLPVRHSTQRGSKRSRRAQSGDDTDSSWSPIKKDSRERKNLQFRPSSIKKSSPDEPLLRSAHGITIDPNFSGSPENSKLKGVLWPGMNLFDAATDEMRRQRNQKKDGSTLRQMEITSKSVQPREVVYSEDWTPMKQREITGLADEDSPLEGEAYIPKKPVRRRKSVLTEASVNVPRASHSTARSANPRGLSYPFEYTEMHRKPLLTLPSSLTGAALETKSRFSPTEDENIEFKLTLGHLAQRRKGGNITVFNDRGDADMPHTTADQIRGSHPLLVPQNQASHVRPPMSLLSASWLQSPYQQPLPYHNLHTAHAQSGSAHLHTKYLSSSKENINPWSMRGDEAQLNPLSWDRSGALAQSQFGVYHQLGYDGSHIALCGLSPNDDVFGYSANPLSAAFPHLQDHPESPFKTSETSQAIHYPVDTKTKSLSPNGTISDHSAGEYSQSVFASYE